MLGEWQSAREHLEQGVALYDPQTYDNQAYLYGQDHGVTCLSFASWALWTLGYPNQALARSREAVNLAQEGSHLNTQAFAWTISLWVHEFRRDTQTVKERAEALISLAEEMGGALWNAWGMMFRGWAYVEQDQPEEGIVQLELRNSLPSSKKPEGGSSVKAG